MRQDGDGDRLNFHPHVHAIANRGVWHANGSFEAIPALDTLQLRLLFRHPLLATSRTGTMQKEIQQGADGGFEYLGMEAGKTMTRSEVITFVGKAAE